MTLNVVTETSCHLTLNSSIKDLRFLILTVDCVKRCQEYSKLALAYMAVMSIWWNCLCNKLIVLLRRVDFSSVCPCTNKWLANTTDVRPYLCHCFLDNKRQFLSFCQSVCLPVQNPSTSDHTYST